MKVALDINILVDVFQKRIPFFETSKCVLNLAFSDCVEAIIPSHALTTLFYIIQKAVGKSQAYTAIDHLLHHFEFGHIDKALFLSAREIALDDFEDAVIAASAIRERCDRIITRNVEDFQISSIPAITPEDFLKEFFPEELAK